MSSIRLQTTKSLLPGLILGVAIVLGIIFVGILLPVLNRGFDPSKFGAVDYDVTYC